MTDLGVRRFAALIPAGPGSEELDRIADTLEAMHAFEPDVVSVVVVDDEPDAARDIVAAAGPLSDRTTVIANPRDRTAHWWSEGVLVGLSAGYDELRRIDDRAGGNSFGWVLRLDSDGIIIGRFADAVADAFGEDDRVGLIGSYLEDPDGTARDFDGPARPVRRLAAPISLWRAQRTVKHTLWGVGRERKRMIDDARANGYQWGHHCQGGAYAMSMAAVRALAEQGWLDCRLWLGSYVSEDVVMALQLTALGFTMRGMSAPGEPFAVRHVGLPGEPAELVAAGYGVAHSLKRHGDRSENDLRAEFRELRGAGRSD